MDCLTTLLQSHPLIKTKFDCHLFKTTGFMIINVLTVQPQKKVFEKFHIDGLYTAMQASCYHLSQSQKRTCKRPPSPKCSTSRMLSDCMKAVDTQSKFPWGLNISKQCHAGWCSVCKWLSRGISDLDTITHQATQRTEETGNHYSHFAIIRCLHMSQVSCGEPYSFTVSCATL